MEISATETKAITKSKEPWRNKLAMNDTILNDKI